MGAYRTVLNHIFEQMDRLDALDVSDECAVAAEVSRSNAVMGMARRW